MIGVGQLNVGQRELLKSYMGESVQKGTAYRYEGESVTLWRKFLSDTFIGKKHPGYFLEGIKDQGIKPGILVLFFADLYNTLGYRNNKISSLSTALKYQFEVSGFDSTFFQDPVCARGRKAARRKGPELKEYNAAKKGKSVLAVGLELVQDIRKRFWLDKPWDTAAGLDSRGTWIASMLSFNSGNRPGNTVVRDKRSDRDHCIRAGNVKLVVRHHGKLVTVSGGEDFRKLNKKSSYEVTKIQLCFESSKNDLSKDIWLDPLKSGEETPVADLVEWLMKSGVLESDELCTRRIEGLRRGGGKRNIRRQDMVSAIKATCEANGPDPARYSAKSMRSGFVTHYQTCGGDPASRNYVGGWTPKSKTPELFYDKSAHLGAFHLGATTGKGVSIAEMIGANLPNNVVLSDSD